MSRRDERWDDASLIRMIERDTIALAMSPAARTNRAKQTGNRKLLLSVAAEECNFKGGDTAYARKERKDGTTYGVKFKTGQKCGAPAVTSKRGPDGRTIRRCSVHIGCEER